MSPRYREIQAPAVIITGDADRIVYPEIHSAQLHEDIAGSTLLRIHNLGHKPDYAATDVVMEALETLAGKTRDLEGVVRRAEARIAGDGPQ